MKLILPKLSGNSILAWDCSSRAKHTRKGIGPIIMLLILCVLSPLAANQARIYPVDSEVYQAIRQLYVAQGLSLPSTAGPWSQDELLAMVDRVDESNLSPEAIPTYEFILDKLSLKLSPFSMGASVAAEGYLHS